MDAPKGMTLIDVVVGTAIMLVVFSGLMGVLRLSLTLATTLKQQAAATTIANNQMEYVRSLSYDEVGTVGGIPAGAIPQNSTTTEDGTSYNVRTFIDYYDDPSDGVGAADTTGITTDYKRIKVTVSYTANGKTRQISLLSNYAPVGLETTTNGGTLQISVKNSAGTGVSGATVHIVNASTSPTVDLSTFSDSTGTVYLPGAATSTQYQITITKDGYSTAKNYARDTTNQNPNPGYLTVVKNQTTSSTFVIDVLGTLVVRTYSPVSTTTTSDAFSDTSHLYSLTNTTVTGNSLTLTGSAGDYSMNGNVVSQQITPSRLSSWGYLMATTTVPASTAVAIHVIDSTGALLPDTVLSNNSAGFTSFPVNLTSVSTTTYPSLGLSADFLTSDKSVRPAITGWSLSARTGPTPLPNVSFTLTGAKTIGSTGAGAPIYKTTVNTSTDNTGTSTSSLEWDSYSLSVSGYDTVDACNAPPFALSPGAILSESLMLSTLTTNAILVTVTDSSGVVVPGATVTLSRSGYSKTVTTSSCGTAYFGSLTSASDYSINLSKAGYTSTVVPNVSVSGHVFYTASF